YRSAGRARTCSRFVAPSRTAARIRGLVRASIWGALDGVFRALQVSGSCPHPRPLRRGSGLGSCVDLGCPGWGVQGTAGQRAGAAPAPLCPAPPRPGAVPALSAQPCSWCPILSYPEHTVDTMTPTPSSTTQNTGPAAEKTDTQFAHKFEPPPGFVTTAVPAVDVLVPDAFSRWDPGQQRGYLAQRAINAAEGGTVLYTYACVRRATEP